MEIKKIVLYFCIGLFLTGCFQSSAMVGPAITLASTGNVSQAGFAYITTKKTKKNEKIDENLLILVQTNFEETRKKLLLQNQSKITN